MVFFQDEQSEVPVLDWLKVLRARDRKGYAKCVARLRRLALLGHELRRPEADYLRDEIHELRAKAGRVNYRILYFFHGRTLAVLAHALTKEGRVPDADIDRAVRRKKSFRQNPKRYSYEEELSNG
jgi:phage-related protein